MITLGQFLWGRRFEVVRMLLRAECQTLRMARAGTSSAVARQAAGCGLRGCPPAAGAGARPRRAAHAPRWDRYPRPDRWRAHRGPPHACTRTHLTLRATLTCYGPFFSRALIFLSFLSVSTSRAQTRTLTKCTRATSPNSTKWSNIAEVTVLSFFVTMLYLGDKEVELSYLLLAMWIVVRHTRGNTLLVRLR